MHKCDSCGEREGVIYAFRQWYCHECYEDQIGGDMED